VIINEECIIRMSHVTKKFPGVTALKNVNLEMKKGSIHGLMGENGAGKSTLIKIISGTYSEYEGEMEYEGRKVRFRSEKEALQAGISVVPQELHPIPEMTIAENIFLGREPIKYAWILDKKERKLKAAQLLKTLGLDYDPDTKMEKLSVAQKQMVEIIKAISRGSRLIIMDEPTSALTNVETEYLFQQISLLKEKGISIIFISHKLDEVYRICDTVTVLRDGEYIDTRPMQEVSCDELIEMMVGRQVVDIYPKLHMPKEKAVLEAQEISGDGFEKISFAIREGEVLGFAGMMGAGRSEIARAVFGLDQIRKGKLILNGREIKIASPSDGIHEGIAMVTEDRAAYGFVGARSIKENISLPNMDRFAPRFLLKKREIENAAGEICQKISVKAPSIETRAGTLSGGNQQKVVLAKWLIRDLKVLIMDEPTRGTDVGAKQEIYALISELARQGIAILLISSELPEVISMSHRVMVIAEGKCVGELSKEEVTQDKIMKLIAGGKCEN